MQKWRAKCTPPPEKPTQGASVPLKLFLLLPYEHFCAYNYFRTMEIEDVVIRSRWWRLKCHQATTKPSCAEHFFAKYAELPSEK